MKLAIIAPSDLPIPAVKGGGIETLATHIINENESLNELKLTVYCHRNSKSKNLNRKLKQCKVVLIRTIPFINILMEFLYKIFVIKLKLNTIYCTLFLYSVANNIKKNDFDYILVEGRPEFVPYLKKKTGVPVILHLHNDCLHKDVANSSIILSCCTKIITVSEFIKNRVLTIDAACELGVTVLKNCTNLNEKSSVEVEESRRYIRQKYNIADTDKVILFTGRIHESKGVKELLNAFDKIEEQRSILLIVGGYLFSSNKQTPYITELKQISKTMTKRVIFTGYIPNCELFKYHAASDIAVIPSICNEAAGLVVIEALSSGLPLITTDAGGITEYTNNECSLTVSKDLELELSLTKALNILLPDSNLLQKMSEKGRMYAKQYEPSEYFLKFVSILSDVEKGR